MTEQDIQLRFILAFAFLAFVGITILSAYYIRKRAKERAAARKVIIDTIVDTKITPEGAKAGLHLLAGVALFVIGFGAIYYILKRNRRW